MAPSKFIVPELVDHCAYEARASDKGGGYTITKREDCGKEDCLNSVNYKPKK
ncbi:hypothetical protein PspLS_01163 [Pyricularia sp. CBS 133598]|nr:hypothetical protein PspLS_01163 [Pyricularia sp. CBS 133598]